MLNSEPAALLIAVLLFVAALAVSFFLGSELVRVVRDLFAQMGGSRAPEADQPPQVNPQQAAARRNRATVERLINKFEEGEPRPAARPKE
jgi:hypothetical protein